MEKIENYPINLLDAVSKNEDGWDSPLPSDIIATVDYVLKQVLTDREREVIRQRYESLLTYEDMGRNFGVTRERIRQIEKKAIMKLRRPLWNQYLKHGVSGMVALAAENARQAAINEKLALTIENISAIAESLNVPKVSEVCRSAELSTYIESLDLSARSYNCLKRTGVVTLEDIVSMTDEQLRQIRNLGLKSYHEILLVVRQHGLKLRGE